MKYFWILVYNLFYPLFALFAVITAIFNPKIRRGLIGRLNSIAKLRKAIENIDKSRPVYWFHSASHGEFEQIRPVLRGLKEIEDKCFVIASFFSPSGYENVNGNNIDCKIYLPFDFPGTVIKALQIANPKKIIFAAYDIWPNLIWSANKLKINTTVVAARFHRNTTKLLPVLNSFFRSVYRSISTIYTITDEDEIYLKRIIGNVEEPLIKVLGNPRYDQVKSQADKFTKEHTISVLLRSKRIIIGSVWPEDEKNIFKPIIQLLNEDDELSLLWVPHEPSGKYIQSSIKIFQKNGFIPTIMNKENGTIINNGRVVIVGMVGVLSKLYWQGQVAYVGGGFSTGVHNVMEPAIARLPVIFGPRHKKSAAAIELIRSGGGFSINNSHEFYDIIKGLLKDKNHFLESSLAATQVIHNNIGSTTRIVRSIIRD